MSTLRVAVDIGGTFTDLQILDEATGVAHAHKVPTTPDDPSEGLIAGIREACARLGVDPGRIRAILHGTTIATNAVLQRRLPAGAVLATAGFTDVLEIGRHVRRQVYANRAEPRALLVPRSRVQHLDIERGPIERRFGLATLVVHTAGTRLHALRQPGLLAADALALRDALLPEADRDDDTL